MGDYYDEGQRVTGQWFGSGAERLGLSGKVGAEAFLRLCENLHPASGDTLTPRLNTMRMDKAGGNADQSPDFLRLHVLAAQIGFGRGTGRRG